MKRTYKILATFFLAQAALGAGGISPAYVMQLQQQQQQQQQQGMMPQMQQMQQMQQQQMAPMQWPMMMSRPMQRFGQAPQMGGYGQAPQMGGPGFMGQQQSLSIQAGPAGSPNMGMGASPQIQNQSRMPAGAGQMIGPQQYAPMTGPGSAGR